MSESAFAELLSLPSLAANPKALRQAQDFLELTDVTFAATTRSVYLEAAAIRRGNPAVKLPDATHLASAWHHGAEVFVTNDKQLLKLSTEKRRIVLVNDFAKSL